MNDLRVVGARIIDPARGVDHHDTLWVRDGKVAGYGDVPPFGCVDTCIAVDANGWALLPALTDLGVCLDVSFARSDLLGNGPSCEDAWRVAALSGGVTRVVAPSHPKPNVVQALPSTTGGTSRLDTTRVAQQGVPATGRAASNTLAVDVYDVYRWPHKAAADTSGYAGHGYGLSCLRDFAALRAAAQYAADAGGRVWILPADDGLARGGVMADGPYALRLGLDGVPADVQARAIAAIAQTLADTGARAHIASLATGLAVKAVRAARASGLAITCDVQAHHLHLTDVDIGYFDTRHKLDPPLYRLADRDALRAALEAGDIDAVVSGHVTVSASDKARFFADAQSGAPALGATLSLMLSLAQQLDWPLVDALRAVTAGPQTVLTGAALGLAPGAPADFCLVDLDDWWQPARSMAMMQPALSPFAQAVLPGRVQATYVRGVRVWESEA
ncbi:MAG: amidohydrolase family protein [Burkholderiaceae bacterium]|nr:amidohydrolase family protein [Burkholderiaceae bacterium]